MFGLAVCQTCRLFRETALGTPSLWTFVEISGKASLPWASICLERAGACGLDIFIDCSDGTLMDQATVKSLLDLISPLSRRWRSLTVESSREYVLAPIVTSLCSQQAPALRYLSLDVQDVEHINRFDIRRESKYPQIFDTGTPPLTFVRLRGMAMHFCRPRLDRVVTLHLDDTTHVPISYSTFIGIITQSECLEHLSLCGDFVVCHEWPYKVNVVCLSKLRSLRLCGVGGELYIGVLMGFHTPSLESLVLKDLQDEDLDRLWALDDSSRYTRLTHLTFSNFDLSINTYRLLCKTFREITSFSAIYSSIAECPMVQVLMENSLGQNGLLEFPWPKLEEVTFSYDCTEKEDKLIKKLGKYRDIHGFPISRIRLRTYPEDEEDIFDINTDGLIICEPQYGSERWPRDRSFFDYSDTVF
ncbi:hypothetical protein JR316_0009850 [Psilocybe cubensis]|nr:hypothetical protein JR316_0009850 [Psilocybe cubensis]KAH9477624.1 hypothetical protein JR316_0009850 [Psilocybe cubensis]